MVIWTILAYMLWSVSTETAVANQRATHELCQGVGLASWYGERHQGETTANGEVFNMHGLTAAHQQLPFGTTIRVTDATSQRSVVVRINDRGPFVGDRILDLSRAAAERLGIVETGVATIRWELLTPESATTGS